MSDTLLKTLSWPSLASWLIPSSETSMMVNSGKLHDQILIFEPPIAAACVVSNSAHVFQYKNQLPSWGVTNPGIIGNITSPNGRPGVSDHLPIEMEIIPCNFKLGLA